MFKKICFLVNYNQYESKRHFTEKLAEALKRKGVETLIYDVLEDRIHENVIAEIEDAAPDFTASFNAILPFPDNRFLWDVLEIPHLSILLDPSLYSVNLINSPFSIVACVDRFDCYGLSTQNFDKVFFMPHAIEKDLFDNPVEKEKIYDVVFLGSCYDYETMRKAWQKEFSTAISDVLDDAIELLFGDNKTPLQEALVTAWRESRLPPQGVDFLKLFSYLDKYTRGLDRAKLITAIKGCDVHVFGEPFQDDPHAVKGWHEQLADNKNITLHDPVSYEESLDISMKSKVCLNSNPFFKDGSHERIFAGAAAHSLVVTTDNLFVRENFADGEDLVLYQHGRWDDLNEKVVHYVNDEDARRTIVDAAFDKVKANHTWDNRAGLLIETMPQMVEKCLTQR